MFSAASFKSSQLTGDKTTRHLPQMLPITYYQGINTTENVTNISLCKYINIFTNYQGKTIQGFSNEFFNLLYFSIVENNS